MKQNKSVPPYNKGDGLPYIWGTEVKAMTISFFLKEPGKDASPVFARISWQGNMLKHYPGIKVETALWDKDHQHVIVEKPKVQPLLTEMNRKLANRKKELETLFQLIVSETGREPLPATLQERIEARFNPQRLEKRKPAKLTFLEYFLDFAERTINGKRIKPHHEQKIISTAGGKTYKTTYNKLKDFSTRYHRKVDFANIDVEFHQDFSEYLTKEVNLALNSIGNHFKNIKAVLNEAKAKGYDVNPAFNSKYFRKPKEEVDNIYLTETELKALEQLDLSKNKRLDAVRDLFVIGCHTGQRYSDWGALNRQQIEKGIIEITQQKTGKTVAIPVHSSVVRIYEKYNGRLPKVSSNQKVNAYLKEVAAMLPELQTIESSTRTKGGQERTLNRPKWQMICSHTARRTFATLEYLAGTPSITIMAITGHTTEKSFLGYIKVTPTEHAQILALKWAERAATEGRLRAV